MTIPAETRIQAENAISGTGGVAAGGVISASTTHTGSFRDEQEWIAVDGTYDASRNWTTGVGKVTILGANEGCVKDALFEVPAEIAQPNISDVPCATTEQQLIHA